MADITIEYASGDGYQEKRHFATLRGAAKYARSWAGDHPEIGISHVVSITDGSSTLLGHCAISGDGIGRITCEGCTLAELFPEPGADDPAMTLAEAKVIARRLGFTLSKVPDCGEYRLNRIGGGEETAYYTNDLLDAIGTARQEVRKIEVATFGPAQQSGYASTEVEMEETKLVQIDADVLSTLIEAAAAHAEHLGELAQESEEEAEEAAGSDDEEAATQRLADHDERCDATWSAVRTARELLA